MVREVALLIILGTEVGCGAWRKGSMVCLKFILWEGYLKQLLNRDFKRLLEELER